MKVESDVFVTTTFLTDQNFQKFFHLTTYRLKTTGIFDFGNFDKNNDFQPTDSLPSVVNLLDLLDLAFVLHAVGAKRVFLQLNCCKNLYHQSRRENMKINNSQHQSNKVTQ